MGIQRIVIVSVALVVITGLSLDIVGARQNDTQVSDIKVSPSGQYVATYDERSKFKLIDQTNPMTIEISNDLLHFGGMDWSPDGTRLAIANRGIFIYNIPALTLHNRFPGGTILIALDWHPAEDLIVYAVADGRGQTQTFSTNVVNTQTGEVIITIAYNLQGIADVKWSNDGTRFSVLREGEIDIYTREGIHETTYSNLLDTSTASHHSWQPNDKHIAISGSDVTIVDVGTGHVLQTLSTLEIATSVHWNPANQNLILARELMGYSIWDVYTGEMLHHNQAIFTLGISIDWDPSGRSFLVAVTESDGRFENISLDSIGIVLRSFSPSDLDVSSSNLSWADNSSDETAFHIERAPDDGTGNPGTFTEIGTVSADITTFTDTESLACGTYYYRVRAFRADDSLFSDYSNTASVIVPCGPNAPIDLSLDAHFLTWSDQSTDETAFHVERATEDGTGNPGMFIEVGTTPADRTAFAEIVTFTCDTYYYRVRAFRADDNTFSEYSNTVSLRLDCVPAAPRDVIVDTMSIGLITLLWKDNLTDETTYHVERSQDGIAWSEIGTSTSGSAIYINDVSYFDFDTSADCATPYQYRVRGYRQSDDTFGAYSDVVSGTFNCQEPPPTNLAATVETNGVVALSWDSAPQRSVWNQIQWSVNGAEWEFVPTDSITDQLDTSANINVTDMCRTRFRIRYRIISDLAAPQFNNPTIPPDYSDLINHSQFTDPITPSNITAVTDVDVIGLRDAVIAANNDPNLSVICLAENGIYAPSNTYNTDKYFPDTTSDIIIEGNGAQFNGTQGTLNARFFGIPIGGSLTIRNATFADNNTSIDGGVLYSIGALSLENVSFINNSGNLGGTIVGTGGTLDIAGSTFDGNSAYVGGAIYTQHNTTITITNSTFTNNLAEHRGGAIDFWMDNTATISNSTFSGNRADDNNPQTIEYGGALFVRSSTVDIQNTSMTTNQSIRGGAIYADNGETGAASVLNITTSTFSTNQSERGGAIRVQRSILNVSESTFNNNVATHTGGAIKGIFSAITIENNSAFTDNYAELCGGAIDLWTDNAITNPSSLSIIDSNFQLNISNQYGGALCMARAPLSIQNSSFTNNQAVNLGGAMSAHEVDLDITSSVFASNSASGSGGAIRAYSGTRSIVGSSFENNTASSNGGALYLDTNNQTTTISNSRFVSNSASGSGGAIRSQLETINIFSSVFTNNIANNGGAVSLSSDMTIDNSCFEGNVTYSTAGYAADVEVLSAVHDIDNNWWGHPTGPLWLLNGQPTGPNVDAQGDSLAGLLPFRFSRPGVFQSFEPFITTGCPLP